MRTTPHRHGAMVAANGAVVDRSAIRPPTS
jgi:hypothetical protein